MNFAEFFASLAHVEWSEGWSLENLLAQVDRVVAEHGAPNRVLVEAEFYGEWGNRAMLFEYADKFVSADYDGEYTHVWVYGK